MKAASKPRIFISFSSSDQHEVRKLFSALQLQGLDCWDYSAAGQEIQLGESVLESLKLRIDACDYFIATISRSTTDEILGRFTRFELEYAIGRGLLEQKKILPILLTASQPGEWSGPYRRLEPFKWIELDAGDPTSFDAMITEICEKLGVLYVPPSLKDPRAFFSNYLLQETEQLQLTNAEFIQLMQIMNKCAEEVANKQWLAAKAFISSFLQLSGLILPRVQLTYPVIVKGVCELELGEFDEAERTFTAATGASGPKAEYFSGLGYAGLGHVFFNQRRFDQAWAAFNRALELLPDNEQVEFNILSSLVQTDGVIINEAILNKLGRTPSSAKDSSNVGKLKGILHYKRKDYRAAIEAFQSLEGEMDEVSAVYLSLAYKDSGNEEKALEILRASARRLQSTNLYHHLASACLSNGYIDEGVEIYERILCQPGTRTRQYLIEYARILKATGGRKMRNKVRELCALVLDLRTFPDSRLTGEDFFYMGFANYLLGKDELAKYEFERSSGFCDKYYDDEAFKLD